MRFRTTEPGIHRRGKGYEPNAEAGGSKDDPIDRQRRLLHEAPRYFWRDKQQNDVGDKGKNDSAHFVLPKQDATSGQIGWPHRQLWQSLKWSNKSLHLVC